ncbi:MAG TPA: glycosyltransferase family 2 protein [Nocardioidaceae bacterium]|nr:glycosyltransferase family 2 protein [Nocardioidaceae bacterium]
MGGSADAAAALLSTSVVICAYTMLRREQLVSAVGSALAQVPAPDQVLVVIDHCPELEKAARDAFVHPQVTVLASEGARGLSAARNTGLAHAHGDVLAFLDDDAVAEPGWLAAHARHYRDTAVVGVGGFIVPVWEGRRPAWFPSEFGWVVGCSYLGQPTRTARVRNPLGANMSFRRDVLRAVGGFTTTLGRVGESRAGCEETELSVRATSAFPGSHVLFDPTAVVRHLVPVSRGTWTYFRGRCWAEGVSKAEMRRMVASSGVLVTERAYAGRVLPRAVGRYLLQAVRERDAAGAVRAGAVVAGLGTTTLGFVAGRLRGGREAS